MERNICDYEISSSRKSDSLEFKLYNAWGGMIASGIFHKSIARRLVACWNACQGISTETLEAGAVREAIEFLRDIDTEPERVDDDDEREKTMYELREIILKNLDTEAK